MSNNQPQSLNLAEVNAVVAGTPFAGHLHHWSPPPPPTISLSKPPQKGARNGVWIADQQTAGRGRGAHTWHSPAGAGLYLTALVAPPSPCESRSRSPCASQSPSSPPSPRPPASASASRSTSAGPTISSSTAKSAAAYSSTPHPIPPRPVSPPRCATPSSASASTSTTPPFPPELDAIATSIRREAPENSSAARFAASLSPLPSSSHLDGELRRHSAGNRNPQPRKLALFSSWITRQARPRRSPRRPRPAILAPPPASTPAASSCVADDDGQIHTVLSGGLREL